MRPLATIDAEIAATAAKLNALHLERGETRQVEINGVVRLFDAGQSIREIARTLKANRTAIQGVLWRAGRTERGRANIRSRALAAVHAEASP